MSHSMWYLKLKSYFALPIQHWNTTMFGQRWTIASKFFDYSSPTVERGVLLFCWQMNRLNLRWWQDDLWSHLSGSHWNQEWTSETRTDQAKQKEVVMTELSTETWHLIRRTSSKRKGNELSCRLFMINWVDVFVLNSSTDLVSVKVKISVLI